MKRAAITGIAGQDGTYLARWLVAKGYEVHGLIRAPFERVGAELSRRFTTACTEAIVWHTGAMEDAGSLFRFLQVARPDEIYHLAGVSDSRQSFAVPEETLQSIAAGTLRLLEAARGCCPAAKLFLASSAEVFGSPTASPQDETTSRQPVTPYGIAKLAADHFGTLYRERYGLFVAVGLLYNHESPLRPPNYLSARVARAAAAASKGQLRRLTLGDLSAERDWSDARDFVRGFWLSLQSPAAGDYVFASGHSRQALDLVDTAFQAVRLDFREYIHWTPGESASRPKLRGNPAKAEALLGWRREWPFEETIGDMVRAELEDRAADERANPTPTRK